jgi:multidrug efflux system membrane fusion protein
MRVARLFVAGPSVIGTHCNGRSVENEFPTDPAAGFGGQWAMLTEEGKLRQAPEVAPEVPHKSPPKRRGGWRGFIVTLLVLVAIGALAWHFRPQGGRPPAGGERGARSRAAPQAVGVAKVTQGDIPIVREALGTVTSLATVTVRTQVSGQLTAIAFQEGQIVKKGDFLAQIDDRAYRAALHQLQGQLERDQALLANARTDLARYEKLNAQNAIASQILDTQRATVSANEGTVISDQAQIEAQQVNIDYCRIVAPITGRVGLRQIDAGNYVTSGDANGIVVITQLQPISVVFSLPEDDLPEIMAEMNAGHVLTVALFDRSDTKEIARGTLKTIDNQIDPTTGTVKFRAEFPNADGTLFPNQFVNAHLLVRTLTQATVVPNAAVQHGAPGTFVYVVGPDQTVAVRPIKTGPSDPLVTQVVSGLSVGDTVVVDGVDRLRDGARVEVRDGNGASGSPAGAASPTGRPPQGDHTRQGGADHGTGAGRRGQQHRAQ